MYLNLLQFCLNLLFSDNLIQTCILNLLYCKNCLVLLYLYQFTELHCVVTQNSSSYILHLFISTLFRIESPLRLWPSSSLCLIRHTFYIEKSNILFCLTPSIFQPNSALFVPLNLSTRFFQVPFLVLQKFNLFSSTLHI